MDGSCFEERGKQPRVGKVMNIDVEKRNCTRKATINVVEDIHLRGLMREYAIDRENWRKLSWGPQD